MLKSLKALDRVLKGESTRMDDLRGGSMPLPVGGLTLLVLILGAVYGACMGSFALMARWGTDTQAEAYLQMLASAAKVPMLFVLTLIVTFPSLYVFNALVGSRLNFGSVGKLMLAALAVTMAVLASFGTIVVFFSLCTTSYPFMVLLNVVMFAVAGGLGMRFLLQTLQRLSVARAIEDSEAARRVVPPSPADPSTATVAAEPGDIVAPADVSVTTYGSPDAPPPYVSSPSSLSAPPMTPGALDRLEGHVFGPQVKAVFKIWIVVFALVGAQMGWVLRPFIGKPELPFTFFREREGNFFEAVVNKIGQLVEGDDRDGRSNSRNRNRWPSPVPATQPPPATQPQAEYGQ